jgi:mono/diheme cytochrome c family protein
LVFIERDYRISQARTIVNISGLLSTVNTSARTHRHAISDDFDESPRRQCEVKMKAIVLTLLLLFAIAALSTAAEELSQEEKAKLANEVKTLFKTKCMKCHGPEGVREIEGPNAEFDFILDLERLAADPTKVIRGDPNESKLFNMVADLLMPDESAGEDPLPDNEIDLIRRWILAGAPSEEGRRAATKYQCPSTKRVDAKNIYTAEQIEQGRFSTVLEDNSEGVFVSRCSFSSTAGKVTCNRFKVDRVEYDQNLKIKKFYVFSQQFNFQIFSDLSSLADNGRGAVQYGQCEFVSD